jgi:hypothetical protein
MNEYDTIRGTARRARAQGLGITECAIRRWVKSGEIPCILSGTRAYVSWHSVLAYIGLSDNVDKERPCKGVWIEKERGR